MAESTPDPYRQFSDEAEQAIRTLIVGLFTSAWWLVRHPTLWAPLGLVGYLIYVDLWPLALFATGVAAVALIFWRLVHPASFRRRCGSPVRRWWRYGRRWAGVARQNGITIRSADGGIILPRLGRLERRPGSDLLSVGLVPGQTPDDFSRAAESLAHSFGARALRVRSVSPGWIQLEFIFSDQLSAIVEPIELPLVTDLSAVPIGITESGEPWEIQLTGTHVLIAGVTGSGKGSVLWSILRGIGVPICEGRVEVWAIDPKGGMELGMGRGLFTRFEASDPERVAVLLEDAVSLVRQRAERLAGQSRQHQPTISDPMVLLVIDEVASLTAYLPDRKLKARIADALAVILTQGRAVGVNVIAALQDPRKEVLSLRNLFPTKIGLRLDEPSQIDMVLGDGARLAGARCDQIPASQPGVGYVRIDGAPEPVRVRASYLDDADVRELAERYVAPVNDVADDDRSVRRVHLVDDEGLLVGDSENEAWQIATFPDRDR